jgi:hypothetical protein
MKKPFKIPREKKKTNVLKWMVLKTSASGFYSDTFDSTELIASFLTLPKAEKFVSEFKMTAYDVRIFIVYGREK